MKDPDKLLTELQDIRQIMENSSRFLSLSGLSGILAGVYALTGAFLAHQIIYVEFPTQFRQEHINELFKQLFIIGSIILILSLITIFFLTIKKARKEQKPLWGPGSKLLLTNLLIPLITGAILVVILSLGAYYDLIAPSLLIFYGLALVNASKYTRPEILGLGIVEILLGLIAAILPAYGLYLWAAGFGLVHIIYGAVFMRFENKQ